MSGIFCAHFVMENLLRGFQNCNFAEYTALKNQDDTTIKNKQERSATYIKGLLIQLNIGYPLQINTSG